MDIFQLIASYGVTLVDVKPEQILRRHSLPNSKLGVGCDPGKKLIYRDLATQRRHHFQDKPLESRHELLLHELAHVICQPPGMSIREVPELAILLPFEYCLAAAHLQKHIDNVVRFQLDTEVFRPGARTFQELGGGGVECYTQPLYSEGYGLCQELGILDEKYRPVLGRYPAWTLKNLVAFRRRCEAVAFVKEAPPTAKQLQSLEALGAALAQPL